MGDGEWVEWSGEESFHLWSATGIGSLSAEMWGTGLLGWGWAATIPPPHPLSLTITVVAVIADLVDALTSPSPTAVESHPQHLPRWPHPIRLSTASSQHPDGSHCDQAFVA